MDEYSPDPIGLVFFLAAGVIALAYGLWHEGDIQKWTRALKQRVRNGLRDQQ